MLYFMFFIKVSDESQSHSVESLVSFVALYIIQKSKKIGNLSILDLTFSIMDPNSLGIFLNNILNHLN